MARKGLIGSFLESVTGDDEDEERGGLRDLVGKGLDAAEKAGVIGDGQVVDKIAGRAKEFVEKRDLGDGSLIDKAADAAKTRIAEKNEAEDEAAAKAGETEADPDDESGAVKDFLGAAKAALGRDEEGDDDDGPGLGGLLAKGVAAAKEAGIGGDGKVIDAIADRAGEFVEQRDLGDGSLIDRAAELAKDRIATAEADDAAEDDAPAGTAAPKVAPRAATDDAAAEDDDGEEGFGAGVLAKVGAALADRGEGGDNVRPVASILERIDDVAGEGSARPGRAALVDRLGTEQTESAEPALDTDRDGVLDANDIDDDNDGVLDTAES